MAIINTIDDLKGVVKVNASTPFSALSPYFDDARDKYLVPYLGLDIVEKLESELDPSKEENEPYIALLPRVRRVLGPFALFLGSAELSINFGDSGHTVSRTNTAAPASDAKIEKSDNSLASRAWLNLEYLIKELETKESEFPKWKESEYYQNRQTKFFDSAATFQNDGLIDIEYKRLAFEKLRVHIISIERTEVWKLITSDVYDTILTKVNEESKEKKRLKLIACIRAYIGNRVAELHTSQTTRAQRSQSGKLEYSAIIRPLYADLDYTGNYYADQTAFWKDEIISLLPDFGVDLSGNALNFNTPERSIMVDIG